MSERVEAVHLRRLVRLRYLVLGGQLAAVLGSRFGLDVGLPLAPMLALIAALAVLNVLTQLRLRSSRAVRPNELAFQLLADIVQLTSLLYLSGGFANPFIFMLLPPLAIAAAALSPWQIGWVAGLAVICYSLLLFAYVPMPMLDRLAFLTPTVLRQTGMWVCFVVSAAMIVVFVVRTRGTLRQKDRELALAREQAMRNDHLAALGSLAAGTAHELGTPLATMSFIAEELEHDAVEPDQRDQLRLLREQVRRCRDAIDELAQAAGEIRASAGRPEYMDEWLAGIAARWRERHPDSTITLASDAQAHRLRLLADRALEQAVSCLISNAVRASRDVGITAAWDSRELVLDVLDRGPGIPRNLRGMIGHEPVSQKPGVQGLGLGLYLATGTIQRLGGTLELSDREGGGTRARMTLPLNTLLVNDGDDREHGHAIIAAG